jgi:hypothetical protein
MRIVIGCDHTGVALKVALQETVLAEHSVIDVGTDSTDSVDYPDIARAAAAICARGTRIGRFSFAAPESDGDCRRPAPRNPPATCPTRTSPR